MPKTLIGIQDWLIGCYRRSGYKGASFRHARAMKSLQELGFTFTQSQQALRDAFDIWELETRATP